MVLNAKKSKVMIFNFSKKSQFTNNFKLKCENLEVLNETKLLGTIISIDLKWNKNTDRKIHQNNSDLIYLYKTFIGSVLEFSAVVA